MLQRGQIQVIQSTRNRKNSHRSSEHTRNRLRLQVHLGMEFLQAPNTGLFPLYWEPSHHYRY